jgi:hypothetical protein
MVHCRIAHVFFSQQSYNQYIYMSRYCVVNSVFWVGVHIYRIRMLYDFDTAYLGSICVNIIVILIVVLDTFQIDTGHDFSSVYMRCTALSEFNVVNG